MFAFSSTQLSINSTVYFESTQSVLIIFYIMIKFCVYKYNNAYVKKTHLRCFSACKRQVLVFGFFPLFIIVLDKSESFFQVFSFEFCLQTR